MTFSILFTDSYVQVEMQMGDVDRSPPPPQSAFQELSPGSEEDRTPKPTTQGTANDKPVQNLPLQSIWHVI